MTADERSDLAVLTVRVLFRLRGIARQLESLGRRPDDVDREIRESIATAELVPALRESMRLEMTRDEIGRWL